MKLSHVALLCILYIQVVPALQEVRGANEDLELPWTPREAALAQSLLGQPGSAETWMGEPTGLCDLDENSLTLTHAMAPLETEYHALSGVYTIKSQESVLGFAVARWASSNIPLVDSAEVIQGSDYRTFDIQNILLRGAYGQRIGNWQLAGILNLLYRQLDQDGLGMRADISARWSKWDWYFGAHLNGLTSSLARWQSENLEYSPPDLKIGLGWSRPSPYFYGSFSFAWQSPTIFQLQGISPQVSEANSDGSGTVAGGRPWDHPLTWFLASSPSIEYKGNSGLSLWLGDKALNSYTAIVWGAEYEWKDFRVSYAFEGNPDLGATHHFGISYTLNHGNKAQLNTDSVTYRPQQKSDTSTKVSEHRPNLEPKDSISLVNQTSKGDQSIQVPLSDQVQEPANSNPKQAPSTPQTQNQVPASPIKQAEEVIE